MAIEFEKKLGGQVLAETLIELINEGLDIVTIENDLRFTFTNQVREAFPDRFVEAGISEANSIGLAAGMSEAGMIPVVHSLTPFITRRCYDQIVISIQYSGLHVKLIGTDPGIYSQMNGGTHLGIEDVSIMRAIPNMLIISPVDNTALKALVTQAMKDERSAYIRISRKLSRVVYHEGATFEIGKANTVREGTDLTIIANDLMVAWSILLQVIDPGAQAHHAQVAERFHRRDAAVIPHVLQDLHPLGHLLRPRRGIEYAQLLTVHFPAPPMICFSSIASLITMSL